MRAGLGVLNVQDPAGNDYHCSVYEFVRKAQMGKAWESMRLYSYVIVHDTGFAPNPFGGWCTLANCKPAIRRAAQVGDWVAGLSPRYDGNRLIYAMRVDEILSYRQYFLDERFAAKIPDWRNAQVVHKSGDNIYEPLPNGGFRQLESMHSFGAQEDPVRKAHDLGGRNVLVSRTFHYFGSQAVNLPSSLDCLKVGRAHKCRFSPASISSFLDFISDKPAGVNAPPTHWPHDDESWKPVPA
jgi:hypothetical protein